MSATELYTEELTDHVAELGRMTKALSAMLKDSDVGIMKDTYCPSCVTEEDAKLRLIEMGEINGFSQAYKAIVNMNRHFETAAIDAARLFLEFGKSYHMPVQRLKESFFLPYKSIKEKESDEDVLNWDAWSEFTPRSSRRVRGKIRHLGRAKPLPCEDPWA